MCAHKAIKLSKEVPKHIKYTTKNWTVVDCMEDNNSTHQHTK